MIPMSAQLAQAVPAGRAGKIDFLRDIQPILASRCYECHGPEKQKGKLRLDSKPLAFQGGQSGLIITPGKGKESVLYARISGLEGLDQMPMGGPKLSSEQIELFRDWIDQGADWPEQAAGGRRQEARSGRAGDKESGRGGERESGRVGESESGRRGDAGPVSASTIATAHNDTEKVPDHWAYKRPVRYPPPAGKDPTWARNPIDNFILARLEAEGLKPSAEASKETLIRRLSLDLIGLPPTIAEVNAFLADKSSNAYEKLVDRLLASPHYGERWARPWLDLARYADTHGYEKDMRRRMWPYRDWVIQAINKDMPFDQFTIEQIAGDLLPNATIEQKVATGFHRNTMINEEGGVDPEEYRVAAVIDRVDTTASVWLGTTLACARCHNHKYDPFTQEEYYKFFAFFNNTEDEVAILQRTERRASGPSITLPPPPYLASHREQLEDEMVRLENILHTETPELKAAQAKWEREMASLSVPWALLDPVAVVSAGGSTLRTLNDKSVLAGGRIPERDTYIVTAHSPLKRINGFRLEVLTDSSLPRGGSGRSSTGNFLLTGFEVEVMGAHSAPSRRSQVASRKSPEPEELPSNRTLIPHAGPATFDLRPATQDLRRLEFSDAVADYSQKGRSIKDILSGDPSKGWGVDGDKEESAGEHQAVFILKEPFDLPTGAQLIIRLKHESDSSQYLIGRFRLSVSSGKDPGRSVRLPARLEAILGIPTAERTEEQKRMIADYYRSIAPALQPARERLAQARDLWKELSSPSMLVMKELSEPRQTHIMIRGNFLDKGKQVTPGVPSVLQPLPTGVSLNRLTLARWLVDKSNPLVARVTVNRFWMEYFGRGLVDTPEDFGTRGDPSTHPQLLDWLAAEFMQQNWSMKALHRLIVTSATYRQNSRVTQELLERDPHNRLLARGARFRMEAETIRDNALAIAGLLSDKMYGPSVFPLQPEGIWNVVYNDDKWQTSLAEDRYRRGIYTFWRRTAPYPFFTTFDAPSRENTCLARVRTNTPLQSLNILNDPVYFDAARGLANRILDFTSPLSVVRGPLSKERIAYAFRLCVAREPEAKELVRLDTFYNEELKHFRDDRSAAKDIALRGEVKPFKDADVSEFAAWTMVANVLLNLDETLTKQ
jgi:hypothetical protein